MIRPNENPASGDLICDEILVVEDDVFVQDAIFRMIERSGYAKKVTCVETGADALSAVKKSKPDVVLVDLGLPDMTGVELIGRLVYSGCQADVMVVTASQNSQRIIEAIQAGATGYFLKGNLETDLLPYLQSLMRGGSPIDPVVARRLLTLLRPPAVEPSRKFQDGVSPLSEKELRVLTYVAKGFSSKEIAELLNLSALTVNTHIRNIYRKMSVKNRTEAVFEAVNQGLIPSVASIGKKPRD